MKKIISIAKALIVSVAILAPTIGTSVAHAACSEKVVKQLETRLSKAESRLTLAKHRVDLIEESKQRAAASSERKIDNMETKRLLYVTKISNITIIMNCTRYPNQCAVAVSNFTKEIARIERAKTLEGRRARAIQDKLNAKLARQQQRVVDAQNLVKDLEARLRACN